MAYTGRLVGKSAPTTYGAYGNTNPKSINKRNSGRNGTASRSIADIDPSTKNARPGWHKRPNRLRNKDRAGAWEGKARPAKSYPNTKAQKEARQRAAERRTSVEAMRGDRMKRGAFKGKYYGPDEFKGDLGILRAWRSAGSPGKVGSKTRSEFAKDYNSRKKNAKLGAAERAKKVAMQRGSSK